MSEKRPIVPKGLKQHTDHPLQILYTDFSETETENNIAPTHSPPVASKEMGINLKALWIPKNSFLKNLCHKI